MFWWWGRPGPPIGANHCVAPKRVSFLIPMLSPIQQQISTLSSAGVSNPVLHGGGQTTCWIEAHVGLVYRSLVKWKLLYLEHHEQSNAIQLKNLAINTTNNFWSLNMCCSNWMTSYCIVLQQQSHITPHTLPTNHFTNDSCMDIVSELGQSQGRFVPMEGFEMFTSIGEYIVCMFILFILRSTWF